MSVVDFAAVTKGAVEREQRRAGVTFDMAVTRVARRLRMAPGTLANIIRQRVKAVSFTHGASILNDAIADLTRQIEHLEHERQILLQMGAGSDDRTLGRVVRAIETVRQTLNELEISA